MLYKYLLSRQSVNERGDDVSCCEIEDESECDADGKGG